MRYGRAVARCFAPVVMVAAIPFAGAAKRQVCPDVVDPPAAVCLATTSGLGYAGTPEDARLAAEALELAAGQFGEIFGRSLPPGLLVLSPTFSGEDARRFARSHGLGFSLSRLSPADKRMHLEAVLRRAVPDADAARIDGILQQVGARHLDTLRHELGHAQFRSVFWPDAEPTDTEYGTPAPDWLDEASAVLMEGKALRKVREKQFLDGWQQSSPAIQPLAEFLTMPHPMSAQKRALMQAQGGSRTPSGVQVMTASGGDAETGSMFYAQSMLFADFLLDSSTDPHILGSISAALAADVDFPAWLADAGARGGLPDNLAALQAAWEAWCTARHIGAAEPAG